MVMKMKSYIKFRNLMGFARGGKIYLYPALSLPARPVVRFYFTKTFNAP